MRSDGMRYAKRKEALTNAIRGWCSYFRYVDAKNNLHAIDEWLRSRIRYIWKSWKNNGARVRNLIKCVVSKWRAYLWETLVRDVGQWRLVNL